MQRRLVECQPKRWTLASTIGLSGRTTAASARFRASDRGAQRVPRGRSRARVACDVETATNQAASCGHALTETRVLDSTLLNLRYAARTLARTPLFAVIAILSIALGVGATTAIVTLANTLLLRPAPGIGDPARVVTLGRTQDGRGFDNMSHPNFVDYRAAKSLSGLAAIRTEPEPVGLSGPGGGEPIHASVVSGNFFDVLQARPALGRFFLPDEDRVPVANPVVVLSHKFWRDRFASDPRSEEHTSEL